LHSGSPSAGSSKVRFLICVGCRQLANAKAVYESHFYFLFIISMHTVGNRWHHSFTTFTSKQREGMDDRAGSGITRVLTTRGKMPVYEIAFVSTFPSDIVPPGIARRCVARTVI
jgi:hypothetical protein